MSCNDETNSPGKDVPEWLVLLERRVLEYLPNAKDFHERLLAAIPVGADLSLAKHKFLYWLLVDDKDGVIRYVSKERTRVINAILNVASLHRAAIDGKVVEEGKWESARIAAWNSANFAAGLARRAAGARGEKSATWLEAKAARVAAKTARSAARLRASSVAESAWLAAWSARLARGAGEESGKWTAIAEKLLELLREAEMPSSETKGI